MSELDVRSMSWGKLRARLRVEEHGLSELSYMTGMYAEKSDEIYNAWARNTEEFRNIAAIRDEISRRQHIWLKFLAIALLCIIVGGIFLDSIEL